MVFSDTSTNLGGVQQVRDFMRVDNNQWATSKIVNSFNNYSSKVTGYAIGADRRFQWDNTNHSKLPEGTTNLVAGQSDYSFLTDEQGNAILSLTRIDIQDETGRWRQLVCRDQTQIPIAIAEDQRTAGLPTYYDKIADNIIRLSSKPIASVTGGLKFFFQRVSPPFTAADTTTTTGFSPLLDRGFVIAAAYDGALTLGLQNLQPLSVELQKEEQKMIEYFANRNTDEPQKFIRAVSRSAR